MSGLVKRFSVICCGTNCPNLATPLGTADLPASHTAGQVTQALWGYVCETCAATWHADVAKWHQDHPGETIEARALLGLKNPSDVPNQRTLPSGSVHAPSRGSAAPGG